MSSGRGFARGGAVIFGGTTCGQVAQLGLLAVLARHTTVGQLGLLLAMVALATIVTNLVDFGTSARMVRESSAGRLTEDDGAAYFTSRAVMGLIASAVVAGAGALVAGDAGSALLCLSPWVALRVMAQGRVALLQSRSRFTQMAQAQVLDRLLAAALAAGLLVAGVAPQVALGAGYAAGSSALLLPCARTDRSQPLYRKEAVRQAFRSYAGGAAFGVTLVVTDLASLDLVLLTAVAGSYEAGLFALPSRVAVPVTTMAASLAAVALASLAAQPTHRDAWSLLRAGTRAATLLTGAALLVGIVVAEPALTLLGGSEYAAAATPLRLVLAGCLLSLLSQLMLAFLQSRGLEAFAARVLVPAIGLSLVGVGVGGALAGAAGAAVGFLLSNLVILVSFATRIRALLRAEDARPPG